MGKTVSVYVPDGVYERLVEGALERGLSLSSYMVQSSDPSGGGIHEKLDRIESKLDLLIPKGMPNSLSAGRVEKQGDLEGDDDAIIAAGQKKLDEKREKLERKKGESNAVWQIRKKVFSKG